MVIPIVILVTIPVFLGIVYVAPFEQPEEIEPQEIPEEPDVRILYFILMGIWTLYLIKIIFQIKKGTFRTTQRY